MTVAQYQPVAPAPRTAISQATSVEQSRAVAEVQSAVIVAQQIPRDMRRAEAEMRDACGRMTMAEQAFYQVKNRGTGPSVHLMRELARVWGNVQYGVNELHRDDNRAESEVLAWAWDVQTNTRATRTFIVPHARMKQGRRQELTDLGDITNNNNNAGARAVRECISAILPKWFTEEAQNICKNTIENGEGVPLPKRVEIMLGKFREIGITEAQLETKIGKKRGAWDAGDVAQMGITYTSITRDGMDKAEAFPVTSSLTEEITAASKPATAPTAPETAKAQASTTNEASESIEAAEPEPAPAPAPDGGADSPPDADPSEVNSQGEFLASKKDLGTIRGLLANAKYSLRTPEGTAKTLTYLASVINRDITAFDDLSERDAEAVIDDLKSLQQQ
ncbi:MULTISPECIES: hypothetical protein [Mycobacteroides]|uniref:hypothetical protein n=1 Tax=Mycobacteroides TaxID=670516 RepID=UPI00078DC806|nr:hypothetical protein [Mycobacteroides abscessus]QRJ69338.1 RecT-like ssDNA binding protein [Mycobacterium phage phiT45-1]AMU62788.1 hypothetical protein A3O03_23875 [Mycobacteroides abscessus]ANO20611.1 hypothetical protein BAB78_20220 [Mycobacteroides abscessus]MDM3924106.1 hypothetical protein [Mycobacteroides abscessus]MDO2967732.1 hypothetical protein [Mycobacteroides abscessus subsp. abscessus]